MGRSSKGQKNHTREGGGVLLEALQTSYNKGWPWRDKGKRY